MSNTKKIILLSISGTIGVLILEFGMCRSYNVNLRSTIISMLWLNFWLGAFALAVGSFAAAGTIVGKKVKDKQDD